MNEVAARQRTAEARDVDVVVIGAGFAGLYALHKLRNDLGLDVQAFEQGSDVGGTWYWNRYPGARSDTEVTAYCYSFDRDLFDQWQWSQRYPRQPEILSYLNTFADRYDLRRSITFDTTGRERRLRTSETSRWEVTTDTGERWTRAVPGRGRRPAVVDQRARLPRPGHVRGRDLPHLALAAARDRLQRQAGRRDRHRLQRRAGHHRDRAGGRAPHRLPAHAAVHRARAARPARSRTCWRRSTPTTTSYWRERARLHHRLRLRRERRPGGDHAAGRSARPSSSGSGTAAAASSSCSPRSTTSAPAGRRTTRRPTFISAKISEIVHGPGRPPPC